MKTILFSFLLSILVLTGVSAQYSNNFDDDVNDFTLPVLIDTVGGNIWEIGEQSAPNFSVNTAPNSIVTGLNTNYGVNESSSFILELDLDLIQVYEPYLIIEWSQIFDCSPLSDGGIIEVSYDSMATWVNMFENDIYQPLILSSSLQVVELSSGDIGMSDFGDNWNFVTLCWNSEEYDYLGKLYLRFTFLSDDIAEEKGGWMLDDFAAYGTIIDNVDDLARVNRKSAGIRCYPNPMGSSVNIQLDQVIQDGQIKIFNRNGQEVENQIFSNSDQIRINSESWLPGIYTILVVNSSGSFRATNQVIKSE